MILLLFTVFLNIWFKKDVTAGQREGPDSKYWVNGKEYRTKALIFKV